MGNISKTMKIISWCNVLVTFKIKIELHRDTYGISSYFCHWIIMIINMLDIRGKKYNQQWFNYCFSHTVYWKWTSLNLKVEVYVENAQVGPFITDVTVRSK